MSAEPDLLYSDVEDDLRASVRALLADRCPPERVLEGCEGDEPYDPKVWRALAVELGCAGLAVPADRGGAGASFREAAVVLEELGRAVTPVPFLGSAVLATAALLACGDTSLLGVVAAGTRTAALAVPFSTAPGRYQPSVRTSGRALTGTVTSVADALPADVLLVPALEARPAEAVTSPRIDALYAVEATGDGVTRSPVVSLDLTRRLCDVTFDAARGQVLAAGDVAERAVSEALTTGAALLASEQLGVAEWCLDTTVAHLRTRHQFGRPVGSFQGLKHRMADLWVAVTQARAVARYAAACASGGGPGTALAAALAQATCSAAAVQAAEECVQLHGGIGFTWEHPAHLYLKRAKSTAIALGTPEWHHAALATLADLPPAVP
jgi:alkylation response protein AidB-like acyl-CoA dehydrogenase